MCTMSKDGIENKNKALRYKRNADFSKERKKKGNILCMFLCKLNVLSKDPKRKRINILLKQKGRKKVERKEKL